MNIDEFLLIDKRKENNWPTNRQCLDRLYHFFQIYPSLRFEEGLHMILNGGLQCDKTSEASLQQITILTPGMIDINYFYDDDL